MQHLQAFAGRSEGMSVAAMIIRSWSTLEVWSKASAINAPEPWNGVFNLTGEQTGVDLQVVGRNVGFATDCILLSRLSQLQASTSGL